MFDNIFIQFCKTYIYFTSKFSKAMQCTLHSLTASYPTETSQSLNLFSQIFKNSILRQRFISTKRHELIYRIVFVFHLFHQGFKSLDLILNISFYRTQIFIPRTIGVGTENYSYSLIPFVFINMIPSIKPPHPTILNYLIINSSLPIFQC